MFRHVSSNGVPKNDSLSEELCGLCSVSKALVFQEAVVA